MMIRKHNVMPEFTSRRCKFHYLTALNLLEGLGVPLKNIYIKCVGVYENYRGEIRNQEPDAGTDINHDTQITLEVGSSSAVDFLPYQFFYGLQGLRNSDNTWEEKARCLMSPFDAAAIRYEAATWFHSLRYEFGIIDAEHLKRYLDLFEYTVNDDSSIDDIMLMVSTLPSLNEWGGNPEIVTRILYRLFKYKTRIIENVISSTPIPEQLQYKLGAKTGRLGYETIVGRSFEEFDSTYELVFYDISPDEVPDLLPGGKMRRRIDSFLSYCMPGDYDYYYTIKVNKSAAREKTRKYLGYSSFL